MNQNTMIMWAIIWISSSLVSIFIKSENPIAYAGIGMLIWWMFK